MYYIVCAIYCEASAFIENLNLKRDMLYKKYQVFKNDYATVIITGAGAIQSAIAISSYFSLNPPKKNDILINVGICGSNKTSEIGEAFLCSKIVDTTTNKSYYPDILFKNNFKEKEVLTFPKICLNLKDGFLADMEASGIYQSGILFFSAHQIIFIKIVSDNLNNTKVIPSDVKQLIQKHYNKIIQLVENAENCLLYPTFDFTAKEYDIYNSISSSLRLTVSMKNKLRQLFYYYKLSGNSLIDILEQIENDLKNTKIKDKNERRKYFEYISRKII